MGVCMIAGRSLPVIQVSRSDMRLGAKKRVMGYPTPPVPESSPQDQATVLPPGQGTLELVGRSPAAETCVYQRRSKTADKVLRLNGFFSV